MSDVFIEDLPDLTEVDGTEIITVTENGITYNMTLEAFVLSMGPE